MLARKAIKLYLKTCETAGISRGTQAALVKVSRTTLNNWEAALQKDKPLDIFVSNLEALLKATNRLEAYITAGHLPDADTGRTRQREKELLNI